MSLYRGGGQSEIRTQGGTTLAGFQDRCIQPLCQLSIKKRSLVEAPPGFEPGIKVLQTHALPLGYGAVKMVPGAGLEPAHPKGRGILSPLRLPISPSGQWKSAEHQKKPQLEPLEFEKFQLGCSNKNGAGNEVRTRDPNLGKVVLYH